MIYDPSNVGRMCYAYDVESMERLERVIEIDTDAGELTQAVYPYEVTADGEMARRVIRFKAIYPIHGGNFLPCMFHCYGRME